MAIPKYHEIQKPILELLSKGETYGFRDMEPLLAPVFHLTEEELEEVYDSGNGRIFLDRISWALSYLKTGQLVERPKKGFYKITELGLEFVSKAPDDIRNHINAVGRKKEGTKKPVEPANSAENLTPEERLFQGFNDIKSAALDEILETILGKHPQAFEELVVELLQKMGYGGAIKDAGEVTQYSNDGGIDGIIKEDVLGFGRIHMQAKRYARDNKIGRVDIQSFVGAMAAAKADKGIFITTSSFTREAHEYVKSLSNAMRLLLMDGEELANHIYDYGLGMSVDRVIEIKKLDSDYWDEKENAVIQNS